MENHLKRVGFHSATLMPRIGAILQAMIPDVLAHVGWTLVQLRHADVHRISSSISIYLFRTVL